MTKTEIYRKSATRLLLIQWSRFQWVTIKLEGSTLITGVNGIGKSTVLDAMTYLLTGNTQFNKAAKDRDRTVLGYVRGDTKSNGAERYLRRDQVISYVAMEFDDPIAGRPLVAAVCIESPNETARPVSSWFVCPGTSIDEINFARRDGRMLQVTPRSELTVRGERLKSAAFLGRDRGTEQILRALGLRCPVSQYRSKLLKMMAFNPENNIDQFIQDCVLEPGKVESLQELREQKRQFERMREMYEGLRQGKIQLEEIERRSAEYENKKRSLQIRELMLSYQELRGRQEEERTLRSREETLGERLKELNDRHAELGRLQTEAQERLRAAESNDLFRGMRSSLDALKRQIDTAEEEIRRREERLAEVLRLQRDVKELLSLLGDALPVSGEEQASLADLAGREHSQEAKSAAFKALGERAGNLDSLYERSKIHLQDAIREREKTIGELAEKIRRLEANILVFPPEIEKARDRIREGLKARGIHTDVHIFAELVQEITDPAWRRAIETFLGRKRFYIIVDGAYCRTAMEILKEQKLYAGNVVITDKLPQTEEAKGSAAEILRIPNVYARRYANYLLNGIHLCEDLDELREYPKGGLTREGMLAKSFAASVMDMTKTELCLGEDAVRCQLAQAKEDKETQEELQRGDRRELDGVLKRRKAIGRIDWDGSRYDFGAAARLEETRERKKKLEEDEREIRENPDFTAVLKEQAAAKDQAEEANRRLARNSQDMGACESLAEECGRQRKELSGLLYQRQREFEEGCEKNPELKEPMLEEYQRLLAKKKDNTVKVITPKTVENLKGELRECEKRVEDAQLQYCRITGTDVNRRGVGYIRYYREEYRDLAHVKIEEAQQKLQKQAERLESAFMNDFVAEIDEAVREAKREMEAINRELRQIPFGNDTYRFVMREKPDRAIFFRICKKLENYMNSPEVYMNSGREDEEMEHDIREFMGIILEEEDELEYTDYRRYFSYDMEISSRQGKTEVLADLSKKQGSASNGEKQTPYFIILAASLLQCYPRNACCARLAFIDEAFSALSRERIEQMVKYFEENQFQVFYAAPPEKISSIGAFIHSTVSLVETGRYTNAVEGLVKG